MIVHRECCPACGGPAETIYRCRFDEPPVSTFLQDYYRTRLDLPGEYRAERCRDCATIYQSDIGDERFLARLYGEIIKARAPTDDPAYQFDVAHPTLSRDGHEIIAAASYLGLPLHEMTTLDYGMGWASWARNARDLGCRSFGFDLSEERREHARQHGILTDIDGAQFDFINSEQLMEHVADPTTLMADLVARLRPGGILKISVPSNRGLLDTLARLKGGQATVTRDEIMPLQPLEHINCFTPQGLDRLAAQFELRAVTPSLRHRYAFLPGVSPRYPRKALKELVRPMLQWRNPSNLYVWLRKETSIGE